MALMMGNLYDALAEGGTSVDAAKGAAEEGADRQKQPPEVRADLAVVKAMLGVLLAGVAALVTKTFFG